MHRVDRSSSILHRWQRAAQRIRTANRLRPARIAVIPAKAEALYNSEAGQSICCICAAPKTDSRLTSEAPRGNDGN
jgi:hypothetical protein